MVFIVRTRRNAAGQLQGVVTDAASGCREPFADASQIGELIASLSRERDAPPSGIAQLDASPPEDRR